MSVTVLYSHFTTVSAEGLHFSAFHFLISAYPPVKFYQYAWQKTNWKGKQSANLQLREGKKPTHEQRR